jgi:hypothetical protein
MEKFNRLMIAFILMAFMACQKDNTNSNLTPRAVNLSDTLSLKMSETVFSGNFSIKFDSITLDNRCPITLNCFAAGTAVAKLIVQKDSLKQTIRLSETALINSFYPLNTITVFNQKIRLVQVSPYPGEFGIAQSDYEIKLKLE